MNKIKRYPCYHIEQIIGEFLPGNNDLISNFHFGNYSPFSDNCDCCNQRIKLRDCDNKNISC